MICNLAEGIPIQMNGETQFMDLQVCTIHVYGWMQNVTRNSIIFFILHSMKYAEAIQGRSQDFRNGSA